MGLEKSYDKITKENNDKQSVNNGERSLSMRKVRENVLFGFATVCLILAAAFLAVGTVKSQSSLQMRELEQYYLERERELLKATRAYLEEEGYENSGVTLTRVVEENGTRSYTVTIHHAKIDWMDSGAREELKKALSRLTFSDGNCSFSHEFLETLPAGEL